jgi:DNA-binding protein H-NS
METMTKSYAQIVKQIEVLKQDAERARQKEIAGVVSRIRDAIRVYSLSADDLGLGTGAPKAANVAKAVKAAKPMKAAKAAKAVMPADSPFKVKKKPGPKPKAKKAGKAPMVVKFRNDSGGTWGGLGKRPDWLRAALAAGKQLSDFAVK